MARPVLAPSRRRGQERVAAIMDGAATVFAERGYEAATMTEIASRASTAIGSLYRFFPTKDLLADALFARYSETLLGGLDALAVRAATLDPFALADALLGLLLVQRRDRDAAVALAETRDDSAALRSHLRASIRDRIGLILAQTGLSADRSRRMAPVVLQAMKTLPLLLREGMDEADAIAEVRTMIACYLKTGSGP